MVEASWALWKLTRPAHDLQELASCVRLLEDWQNDVDRLREMESKLQQHQDDLQQLEAEQSDLRENIRVRRATSPLQDVSLTSLTEQVGERRIGMAQAELLRAKDRMDRKKAEHVARKQALEDQHAECVQKKREYDDQAAKKNAEAQQVEQQVRRRPPCSVTPSLTAITDCFCDDRSHRSAICTPLCSSSSTRARRRSSASSSRSVSQRRLPSWSSSRLTLLFGAAAKYSIRLNQALDSINELNAIEPDF